MKLWPFSRKSKASDQLPEEVKEYYESTRKERVGASWLFGLGTLVLTGVLAVALFFGGRWVWNRFDGDEIEQPQETSQTQTTDQNQITSNDADNDSVTSDDDGQDTSSTNTDEDTSDSSEDTTVEQTPATGPTSPEIPDTGPGPGGLQ